MSLRWESCLSLPPSHAKKKFTGLCKLEKQPEERVGHALSSQRAHGCFSAHDSRPRSGRAAQCLAVGPAVLQLCLQAAPRPVPARAPQGQLQALLRAPSRCCREAWTVPASGESHSLIQCCNLISTVLPFSWDYGFWQCSCCHLSQAPSHLAPGTGNRRPFSPYKRGLCAVPLLSADWRQNPSWCCSCLINGVTANGAGNSWAVSAR